MRPNEEKPALGIDNCVVNIDDEYRMIDIDEFSVYKNNMTLRNVMVLLNKLHLANCKNKLSKESYFKIEAIIENSRRQLFLSNYVYSIRLLQQANYYVHFLNLQPMFIPIINIMLIINFRFINNRRKVDDHLYLLNKALKSMKSRGANVDFSLVKKIESVISQKDPIENNYNFLFRSLQSHHVEFVYKVLCHIEKNLTSPNLSVALVSKEMFLSQSQLYRKIKKATGYSAIELIRIVKLNRAKYLLEKKLGNISEIALKIGYTPSHLSKAFVKEFGMNPNQFFKKKVMS